MSVRLERDGAVACLVLDRPAKRNALTIEMLRELGSLADLVADDPQVRAVVVRGEGPVFCAGADLAEFAAVDPPAALTRWTPVGQRAFARLAALPQPSIAAITGSALGGGLELALATTFRVAGTDSVLGMPEIGIGTLPGWSGLTRLPALVGTQRARRMLVLGDRLPAGLALDWGLLDRVDPDPVAAATALARELAERPATAVRLSLAALADGGSPTTDLVERLAAATTVTAPEVRAATAGFGGA
ncbi:enoyl-CoA hydratase/isomerase family protein [Saccharopolyspora spinosa]|uniref:Enoyl-CoA hydratase/carnithine racemase n=1 Tax=Saccharopolyspora spinosa TaxID=60894 RepID=A0A2N3XY57_SACSN|nr:enoyl-CoA hydratase/isomerase family protein [Saccharopolyspora spinosa]PKW15550.1 enoyl-CoA hydratase/carnithine racemase [Saccharopolyspora spinosa]